MAVAPGRRLPFDPVTRLLDGRRVPMHAFAEQIGMDRALLLRYRRDGLTINMADRLAHALGYHPFELWPDEWGAADEDEVA